MRVCCWRGGLAAVRNGGAANCRKTSPCAEHAECRFYEKESAVRPSSWREAVPNPPGYPERAPLDCGYRITDHPRSKCELPLDRGPPSAGSLRLRIGGKPHATQILFPDFTFCAPTSIRQRLYPRSPALSWQSLERLMSSIGCLVLRGCLCIRLIPARALIHDV